MIIQEKNINISHDGKYKGEHTFGRKLVLSVKRWFIGTVKTFKTSPVKMLSHLRCQDKKSTKIIPPD
jgi:hypothetical protein